MNIGKQEFVSVLALTLGLLACPGPVAAQQPEFERLSPELLEVVPPSDRVSGPPGRMSLRPVSCRNLPAAEVRRRIVDVAIQEWGFFGFSIVDETRDDARGPGRVRRPRLSTDETLRVNASIAGYWAATPDGSWILDRQNDRWNGQAGPASRWRDPWSAAFISWVMCEGGLGETSRFRRAIAHHTYIDQAIRSRDGRDSQAAFTAYDAGEAEVLPGDLLCRGSRPDYESIAERRRQMGVGARAHCDIVVKVDAEAGRVLAIGGNVRGTVSLKVLPALAGENLVPIARGRPVFAHLKLNADAIEADGLGTSPTIRAVGCTPGFAVPIPLAAVANLAPGPATGNLC